VMLRQRGQSRRIGSLPSQPTAASRTASKIRRRVGVSSAISIIPDLDPASLCRCRDDKADLSRVPKKRLTTFLPFHARLRLSPAQFTIAVDRVDNSQETN
jgi:hypothetical protein